MQAVAIYLNINEQLKFDKQTWTESSIFIRKSYSVQKFVSILFSKDSNKNINTALFCVLSKKACQHENDLIL